MIIEIFNGLKRYNNFISFFGGSFGFLGFLWALALAVFIIVSRFLLLFIVEFPFLSVVYQLVIAHDQYHSFYITLLFLKKAL